MKKRDWNYLLLGASTILLLMSVASLVDGWAEVAMKLFASLLTAWILLRTVTARD